MRGGKWGGCCQGMRAYGRARGHHAIFSGGICDRCQGMRARDCARGHHVTVLGVFAKSCASVTACSVTRPQNLAAFGADAKSCALVAAVTNTRAHFGTGSRDEAKSPLLHALDMGDGREADLELLVGGDVVGHLAAVIGFVGVHVEIARTR